MEVIANNFTHCEVSFKDVIQNKPRTGGEIGRVAKRQADNAIASGENRMHSYFSTRLASPVSTTINPYPSSQPFSGFASLIAVVSFQRPAYYHFRTLRDGVWKENLKIFSVPVSHGRVRVLFESPLSNSKVPTWLVHAGSNRFLNTDAWLHDAERFSRGGSEKLNYLYPTSSDIGTRTFRSWWQDNGMAQGEG